MLWRVDVMEQLTVRSVVFLALKDSAIICLVLLPAFLLLRPRPIELYGFLIPNEFEFLGTHIAVPDDVKRDLADISGQFLDAVHAQGNALLLFGHVAVSLADFLFPFFRNVALLIVEHQCSLGPVVWALELMVVLGILLVWWIRRLIVRSRIIPRTKQKVANLRNRVVAKYTATINVVAAKSKLAALMFPHVCYWGLVLLLMITIPGITTSLCTEATVFIIGALYPAVRTVQLLRASDPSPDALLQWLGYWVVGGALAFVLQIASVVPFLSYLNHLAPQYYVILFFFAVWIHVGSVLPFVLSQFALPVLSHTVQRIQLVPLLHHLLPSVSEGGGQVTAGSIERMLDSMHRWGILRGEILVLFLKDIVRHIILIAAALFTILFPLDPFWSIGHAFVKFGFPAFLSAQSLTLSTDQNRNVGRWLKYWAVIVISAVAVAPISPILAYMPFSSLGEVLLLVWLQLPFFDGLGYLSRLLIRRLEALERWLSQQERESERTPPGRHGNHPGNHPGDLPATTDEMQVETEPRDGGNEDAAGGRQSERAETQHHAASDENVSESVVEDVVEGGPSLGLTEQTVRRRR